MATMGGDRRQMMEDAAEDKFPEGLRILVVDDDRVCLTVLEALLRRCKYQPTTVMDAKTALRMLMAGKQQFDLVITDVRMPDMDGFKLLELIRLEMNLPVISTLTALNPKLMASYPAIRPIGWRVGRESGGGVTHELVGDILSVSSPNQWHPIQPSVRSDGEWGGRAEVERHMMLSVDCDKKVVMKGIEQGASEFMVKPVHTHELKNIWQHVQRWRNPKAISHISDHDSDVQRVQPATADKSKLSGNKRNVGDDSNKHNESTCVSATHRKPRVTWTIQLHNKFLEAINQIGLDRAVPKKKYRLHLKKVNSNHSGDAYERWNSSYNMNNKGNFMHNHEHGRWSHLAPAMNNQSNFDMGSYLHDGRMLSNSYADLMCGKLMEISKGKTPSNCQSSFANTTVGGGRSLVASQVNFPQINQLESYAMSSGRLPLQNEKAPFISNTALVGGFTEQMAPFNMASNTSSVGTMLNGSSALDASRTSTKDNHLVNSERTTSMLHNLQTDDFFSLTQLLDGGDGASILPMQEGTLDQQPLNDQLNEINAFSVDDIFSNMNLEDFTGDDPIVEEA
ncbi:hypothetical protein CFC21_038039 [Triticum aestivum]|uniref:Response regulatory domain-containing protein n=2 Tax=Triticum aestivum TaxID=4565 RepID=A0A3B6EPK7_WHEAT|nr:hypothetical protein CFC21_038039 [Triticum aestivum]